MTSQMSLDLHHKADDGAFYVIIKIAFSKTGPIATSYGFHYISRYVCLQCVFLCVSDGESGPDGGGRGLVSAGLHEPTYT